MIPNTKTLPKPSTRTPLAVKQNKNHDHPRSDGLHLEPVRFEFTHPTASTVCVAGTFNDWHAQTKPLLSMGNGRWMNDTVLPVGTYEYRLVVDGIWITDPQALETVPNPFGGRNSILRVVDSPEATHLADAAHLLLKNANH